MRFHCSRKAALALSFFGSLQVRLLLLHERKVDVRFISWQSSCSHTASARSPQTDKITFAPSIRVIVMIDSPQVHIASRTDNFGRRTRSYKQLPTTLTFSVTMASEKRFPPVDGSITAIMGNIDWQAQHYPDEPCIVWPDASSPTGTKWVTFAQYAEATHRIAHLLRAGGKHKDRDVVAILIHTDTLLYCALMAGCIRANLVVCFRHVHSDAVTVHMSYHSPFPCLRGIPGRVFVV